MLPRAASRVVRRHPSPGLAPGEFDYDDRVKRLPAAIVALLLLASSAVAQDVDLVQEIARAAALSTPKERAKAADALAAREGVTVDLLLGVLARYAPFAEETPGVDEVAMPEVAAGASCHLLVPEGYDPKRPTPLLVSFHAAGTPSGPDVQRWREIADRLGMLVLSPADGGPNEGYRFTDPERAAGLEAIRRFRLRFNVDEDRIVATGISRGGHMTWDVALRRPDLFAAIAPMVGGPRWNVSGGQNNMRYLENVAHLPIRDLQGLQDDPAMIFNLRVAFEKLAGYGATDARLLEFPDRGHDFDFGAVDWEAFWGAARRDPLPGRVVRLAAREDEVRAFWIEITTFDRGVQEVFPVAVDPKRWAKADDAAKKRMVIDLAEGKTARVEARMTSPGHFEVRGDRVKQVRLLLSREMFEPGKPVAIRWNNRNVVKRPEESAAILLRDFVERLDRRFLPVAEVLVP